MTGTTFTAYPLDNGYYAPGFQTVAPFPQDAPKSKVIFWRVDDGEGERVALVARFVDGNTVHHGCDQHPGASHCEHAAAVNHAVETKSYHPAH